MPWYAWILGPLEAVAVWWLLNPSRTLERGLIGAVLPDAYYRLLRASGERRAQARQARRRDLGDDRRAMQELAARCALDRQWIEFTNERPWRPPQAVAGKTVQVAPGIWEERTVYKADWGTDDVVR